MKKTESKSKSRQNMKFEPIVAAVEINGDLEFFYSDEDGYTFIMPAGSKEQVWLTGVQAQEWWIKYGDVSYNSLPYELLTELGKANRDKQDEEFLNTINMKGMVK